MTEEERNEYTELYRRKVRTVLQQVRKQGDLIPDPSLNSVETATFLEAFMADRLAAIAEELSRSNELLTAITQGVGTGAIGNQEGAPPVRPVGLKGEPGPPGPQGLPGFPGPPGR